MILFAILVVMVVLITALVVLTVGAVGAAGIVVFAEPIICIVLLVWLFRLLRKKK